MKLFRGTVKSYDQQTGKGFIASEGVGDVSVDLDGSKGILLAVGQHVEFQGIHRPEGLYASDVRVIPQVV